MPFDGFTPDENNRPAQHLLRLVEESNASIFLTGRAGTGKSTLLRYVDATTAKKHVVLAPTGVAAVNAGGQTIRSFFRLPFGPLLPDLKTRKSIIATYRAKHLKLIRSLELIIIDEVSMLRSDTVDMIDMILRRVRMENELPFGGVQMLFVGDLFQLEPVVSEGEKNLLADYYATNFFFGALAFKAAAPLIVSLEKVYRQKDLDFIRFLDAVRMGKVTASELARFNEVVCSNINSLSSKESDLVVTVSSRRSTAARINEKQLDSLHEKEHLFHATKTGTFAEGSYPADEVLCLKPGAQVMFLNNDAEHRWYNGSLGECLGFEKNEDGELCVRVLLETGEEYEVQPYTWENRKYEFDEKEERVSTTVLGRFSQIPLRLAWAITIHKSQGLTFDRVTIDLEGGAFAAGQTYVALSRCRSLEGLSLTRPLRLTDIISNSDVHRFYLAANDEEALRNALAPNPNP